MMIISNVFWQHRKKINKYQDWANFSAFCTRLFLKYGSIFGTRISLNPLKLSLVIPTIDDAASLACLPASVMRFRMRRQTQKADSTYKNKKTNSKDQSMQEYNDHYRTIRHPTPARQTLSNSVVGHHQLNSIDEFRTITLNHLTVMHVLITRNQFLECRFAVPGWRRWLPAWYAPKRFNGVDQHHCNRKQWHKVIVTLILLERAFIICGILSGPRHSKRSNDANAKRSNNEITTKRTKIFGNSPAFTDQIHEISKVRFHIGLLFHATYVQGCISYPEATYKLPPTTKFRPLNTCRALSKMPNPS